MRRMILVTAVPVTLVFLVGIARSEITHHKQEPLRINGATSPELVPAFLAWRSFFLFVDISYINSTLDYYLDKRVGLMHVPGYPGIRKEAMTLIADYATWFTRESKRLSNQNGDLRRAFQAGHLTLSGNEFEDKLLQLIRQEVRQLHRATTSLRDGLIALDPDHGGAIWNQLVTFMSKKMKEGISLSTDQTPQDFAIQEVWNEFEPQPVARPKEKK